MIDRLIFPRVTELSARDTKEMSRAFGARVGAQSAVDLTVSGSDDLKSGFDVPSSNGGQWTLNKTKSRRVKAGFRDRASSILQKELGDTVDGNSNLSKAMTSDVAVTACIQAFNTKLHSIRSFVQEGVWPPSAR